MSTVAQPLVVGYDGSPPSEKALARGFAEAKERGTGLVIVVVAGIQYGSIDPLDPMSGVAMIPTIPEDGPVEIQPILDLARQKLADSGVDGKVEWSLGDPATEIVRVAREANAKTIVVGNHHHSALGRFFGTDTAAELERHNEFEVLVAD
jgi:nucleotide-binding universal stress UspA family protein